MKFTLSNQCCSTEMADRVAAMMAEIEAKQREVERIIAEEAKKNVVPPLIEVLEDCISYRDECSRLSTVAKAHAATVAEAKAAYDAVHGFDAEHDLSRKAQERVRQIESDRSRAELGAHHHLRDFQHLAISLAVPNLDDYKNNLGQGQSALEMWNKAAPLRVKLLEARVFWKCMEKESWEPSERLGESTVTTVKAHLVAARADAEWKIQSFKIIDALTQRVAALEARLDAKETVPLGTPVLGSVPDSGEDSCEVFAEEPVRRTLFPYW